MKRTLLMVLLLLIYAVGGAIINVAVAWGCVVWTNRPSYRLPQTTPYWLFQSDSPLPRISDTYILKSFAMTEVYARSEVVGDPTIYLGDAYTVSQREFQSGIPMRALGYAREVRSPTGAHVWDFMWSTASNWREGLAIPAWVPGSRQGRTDYMDFPTQPIWPGFAINTIFYAAILWLLFTGHRFVRRRIRARRGQCPVCAYPIRGRTSDVCTECGGILCGPLTRR